MTVGEDILNEIERVTAKRERWNAYARDAGPQANFAPAIMMMTMTINAAKAAVASNDVVAILQSYEALKEFDDED